MICVLSESLAVRKKNDRDFVFVFSQQEDFVILYTPPRVPQTLKFKVNGIKVVYFPTTRHIS